MWIYVILNDREFKIAVLEKLKIQENTDKQFNKIRNKINEIHENTDRQFNELRNEINEQKAYFTKEIET